MVLHLQMTINNASNYYHQIDLLCDTSKAHEILHIEADLFDYYFYIDEEKLLLLAMTNTNISYMLSEFKV